MKWETTSAVCPICDAPIRAYIPPPDNTLKRLRCPECPWKLDVEKLHVDLCNLVSLYTGPHLKRSALHSLLATLLDIHTGMNRNS